MSNKRTNKKGADNKMSAPNNRVAAIVETAKKLGVDKVYENSKGELFTQLHLAVLSEVGDKKNVKTHFVNAYAALAERLPGNSEDSSNSEDDDSGNSEDDDSGNSEDAK